MGESLIPRVRVGALTDDDIANGGRPPPAPVAAPVRLPERPRKLFAFTVSVSGAQPRSFEFENAPVGRSQLANLIRNEHVLRVVIGHDVPFEVASQVDLDFGDERLSHRQLLRGVNDG